MRLAAIALAGQPRIGIGRRSVRRIAAFLALPVHQFITRTAILILVLILGLGLLVFLLATLLGLGGGVLGCFAGDGPDWLQALVAGQRTDQCAIDREMIRAGQALIEAFRHNSIEELPVQIVNFEPITIHAERLLGPGVMLHRQVQEPAAALKCAHYALAAEHCITENP